MDDARVERDPGKCKGGNDGLKISADNTFLSPKRTKKEESNI